MLSYDYHARGIDMDVDVKLDLDPDRGRHKPAGWCRAMFLFGGGKDLRRGRSSNG